MGLLTFAVYFLVGALVVWSVVYLIYEFHRRLKGKRGCGNGGCASCPHGHCRHRKTP